MANLFLVFLLFSITILIVAGTVDINFTYTDTLKIKIDFLLFTLLLYKRKGFSRDKKRNAESRFKRGIKKSYAARRTLGYLLKNSSLTVHTINIPKKDAEPSSLVTLEGNISSLILIFFTYLSFKTQRISLLDNHFITPYEDSFEEPILDFTLKTSLLVFLFAVVIYNFELRRNERSVKKSVRNKNG